MPLRLSENFGLEEFTRCQAASRLGIANVPPADSIPAIRLLVERVLQPARTHFGKPMSINSGYRCRQANEAIHGAKDSQHIWTSLWAASDIEMLGIDNLALAHWIKDNCPCDQLISECYDHEQGPSSGWVHVSLRTDGRNRNELLTFQAGKGYTPGLPALPSYNRRR